MADLNKHYKGLSRASGVQNLQFKFQYTEHIGKVHVHP